MEETKVTFFEEIISQSGYFHMLNVTKTNTGPLLCASSQTSLYLYTFSEDKLIDFKSSYKDFICENLGTTNKVVSIFILEGKRLVLDEKGFLYHLSEVSNDGSCIVFDDSDIFEDSPKRSSDSWSLSLLAELPDCGETLASCPLTQGIAILSMSNQLSLHVFQLQPCFKKLQSIKLSVTPKKKSLVVSLSLKEVSNKGVKDWLPGGKDMKDITELIFISVDELVYCVAVKGLMFLPPLCVHTASQTIVHMAWSKYEGGYEGLELVLFGGAVLRVQPTKEDILYLPVSRVGAVLLSSDAVLVTDYLDSFLVSWNEKKVISLPLKGLVAFCEVPTQPRVVLASTRHKSVYRLNLSIQESEINSKWIIPQSTLFDELFKRLDEFREINVQIEQEDRLLKALSLARRSPWIHKHITLTIKTSQILGELHVFRVKATVDLPSITFPKNMWQLSVALYKPDFTETVVQPLKYDFNIRSPLLELFRFDIPSYDDSLKITCKLVCPIQERDFLVMIPIGEVHLDATYFLQPASVAFVSQSPFESNETTLRSVFKGTAKLNRKEFSVSVPITSSEGLETRLTKALANSRALWRSAEWQEIGKTAILHLVVFGFNVSLYMGSSTLAVSSRNFELCHSIKAALAQQLVTKNPSIKYDSLVEIKNIMQSLEILRLECEFDTERLKELHRKLRSITDFHSQL